MKSNNIFLLVVVLFFSTYNCNADQTYLLSGTIGTLPIFMTFNVEDQSADIFEAKYYYKSSLKDIVMAGKYSGNSFTFYFADNEETASEKFILLKTGLSSFKGNWTDSKGKKLPVLLNRLYSDSIKNPYENLALVQQLKRTDVFDYLRLSFVSFKRDSSQVYKEKSFVWFNASHCDMSFFRLGNGFDKSTLNTINPKLDEIHLQKVLEQLSCASLYSNNDNSLGIDFSSSITYLSDDILGFQIFASWFCGGAHPDFGGEGFAIDLHSGKSYELDEIIAFDKSATTKDKGGFDAYSTYREDYFAPSIVKLVKEIYHIEKPTDQDECDYTDPESWNFISWNLEETGIAFTPYFPRVMRACEEPFLIPFEKLLQYKQASFPYRL